MLRLSVPKKLALGPLATVLPGAMVCREQDLRVRAAGTWFPSLKPRCRQLCVCPALTGGTAAYSKICPCVLVTSTVKPPSDLHLIPHTQREARAVGFEECQHLLARHVAPGGAWCSTPLLCAWRELLLCSYSKFPLALNLADSMTIFQICSQ